MTIQTKAYFVDDAGDRGVIVECQRCHAQRIVGDEWIEGKPVICHGCNTSLCYPPGASW